MDGAVSPAPKRTATRAAQTGAALAVAPRSDFITFRTPSGTAATGRLACTV